MSSDHANLAITFFVLTTLSAVIISSIALIWYMALGETFGRIVADAIASVMRAFGRTDE